MIKPSKGRHRPRTRRSELERLVDRTELGPTHPELGTCWRFTGTATPYGRIAKAQDSYTHRLGWKLLRGPMPEGMELHHRCGVHACWNPDHLEVVTHAQNSAYARKTQYRRTAMSGVQCSDSAGVQEAPCHGGTRRNEDLRLLCVPYKNRYVN
jgi:HNH endonuclease